METYVSLSSRARLSLKSDTKYRDIADGNVSTRTITLPKDPLETKYRDIADGNACGKATVPACREGGNQVPQNRR